MCDGISYHESVKWRIDPYVFACTIVSEEVVFLTAVFWAVRITSIRVAACIQCEGTSLLFYYSEVIGMEHSVSLVILLH